MSLIRSFTTRFNKSDDLTKVHIGRAASQRAGKSVSRAQISSPTALVSSTNALSFEAPNIVGTSPIQYRDVSSSSSAASAHSADESDASTISIGSHTDTSSIDDSGPVTPEPEPNHLSCYFKPAVDTNSGRSSPAESMRNSLDAPIIPKRVPSHSKKAHEQLHRKRSVQRMMSPPRSIVGRNSTDMFSSVETPRDAPFDNELAQLDEAAEELSQTVRVAEADADSMYMESLGLARFGASDYLSEIHSLIYDVYLAEEPTWL